MITRQSKNKRKRTPIPGLAEHIAAFTDRDSRVSRKAVYAAIRAAFADKVYAASSPIRKETTQCQH